MFAVLLVFFLRARFDTYQNMSMAKELELLERTLQLHVRPTHGFVDLTLVYKARTRSQPVAQLLCVACVSARCMSTSRVAGTSRTSCLSQHNSRALQRPYDGIKVRLRCSNVNVAHTRLRGKGFPVKRTVPTSRIDDKRARTQQTTSN